MRRRLASAVLLAFTVTPLWAADYQKSFVDGIRAKEQRNWQQVITKMSEAAAEKNTEGEQVRMPGMFVEGYFPHYYLGLAYYNSRNLTAALQELRESERQGAIRSSSALYQSLREMRDTLQTKTASTATGPAEEGENQKEPKKAEKPEEHVRAGADAAVIVRATERAMAEINHAEDVGRAMIQSEESPLVAPVWQREPGLRARQSQAGEKVAAARAKLLTGKASGNPLDLDAAAALASAATQGYEEIKQALLLRKIAFDKEQFALKSKEHAVAAKLAAEQTRLEEEIRRNAAAAAVEVERQELDRQLQRRIGTARMLLSVLSRTRGDGGVDRVRAELQRATDQALAVHGRAAGGVDLRLADQSLSVVTGRANEVLSRVARASREPPLQLMTAAASYFTGDYRHVLTLLENISFPDARATSHALLLRAAARHALYFLGGRKDRHLLELAASDAHGCHRVDATLRPLRTAFPPNFAEFFRKNR